MGNFLDISILVAYIAVVLVIGYIAKKGILSHKDFFLAGRKLPVIVTGIAYTAANFGALEIVGGIGNVAQYGLSAAHFNLTGAIPAMLLLGIFLMVFYYVERIRTVQEYFKYRFDDKVRLVNSIIFILAQISIAGINIYIEGVLLNFLLGINLYLVMIVSAILVGIYITMGGIVSGIYTEVLQFVIISLGLIPLVFILLHHLHVSGGIINLLHENVEASKLYTWQGTSPLHRTNFMTDWVGIIFGGMFVLGFGYWTTNFVEVQRAMAAKDLNSARLTPIVGIVPKFLYTYIFIIIGMASMILLKHEVSDQRYNYILPDMIEKYLPHGLIGLAITGLLASFMSGMSSNITAANAVLTYDILEPYVFKKRKNKNYSLISTGRMTTIFIIIASILTSFIASRYTNIQNYLQALFGYFNTPIFIVFMCGVFLKRTTNFGALMGMVCGPISGFIVHQILPHFSYFHIQGTLSGQLVNYYTAISTAVVTLLTILICSNFGTRRPESEIQGLIFQKSVLKKLYDKSIPFYKQPIVGGVVAIIATILASIQLYMLG